MAKSYFQKVEYEQWEILDTLNAQQMFAELMNEAWASLVAQWLRIRLPIQGTRVWALVWEDPTCCGATKPMGHNYWACALEPKEPQLLSPRATTTEARAPRSHTPQQEKPLQWEAHALQQRVAPAHHS